MYGLEIDDRFAELLALLHVVEHIVERALHDRARAQVRQCGTCFRLRHRDCDDAFAGDDLRDEARAQGFGSEMRNGEDGAKAGFEDGKGDRRRDLGEFFEHDDGVEMGKPVPAILFG